MTEVIRADLSRLDEIASLFDAYRQFYKKPANLGKARNYIEARLKNEESVIFLAIDDEDRAIGFTQLYPTFCSVSAQNVWVLYDLFVKPEERRRGAARALMRRAKKLGEETGAAWLKLETAVTNAPGQSLYESEGWDRETEFYTYFLPLNN